MTVTRGCIGTIFINRNKHIEKNLCITLVIYQESLHDARSTKCKQIIITLMALPNNDFCAQVFEPSCKRIVLREQIVSRRSGP